MVTMPSTPVESCLLFKRSNQDTFLLGLDMLGVAQSTDGDADVIKTLFYGA